MVENSLSKSTLICAAHTLIKELSSFVDYFPSYEIFNDELRWVELDRQLIYIYDDGDFDVIFAIAIVLPTVLLIEVVTFSIMSYISRSSWFLCLFLPSATLELLSTFIGTTDGTVAILSTPLKRHRT
jgi:GSCFA family